MRELKSHIAPGTESPLVIRVLDEPGPGGASSAYMILGHGTSEHATRFGSTPYTTLKFQSGPLSDGVNGFTIEALLAIAMDRLQGFQSGPFANEHNEAAINCLTLAMMNLHDRTAERAARGVLGTHQV